MVLTLGRHIPADSPRGDYSTVCDSCDSCYLRSELRKDENGLLYCKLCDGGLEAVTLNRLNAEGARAYAQRKTTVRRDGRACRIDFTSTHTVTMEDPLELLLLYPADDAEPILEEDLEAIWLMFSERMIAGSGQIHIWSSDGEEAFSLLESIDVATSQVQFAAGTVTVTPTSPLPLGNYFYVLVDEGALQSYGGQEWGGFDEATEWNFTLPVQEEDQTFIAMPGGNLDPSTTSVSYPDIPGGTPVTVKLWGAGGGPGGKSVDEDEGGAGAPGGYTEVSLLSAAIPDVPFTILFELGGCGLTGGVSTGKGAGGSGGGGTVAKLDGVDFAWAGGGGGGGGGSAAGTPETSGGGLGGGEVGGDGSGTVTANPGEGGTQLAPGAGGASLGEGSIAGEAGLLHNYVDGGDGGVHDVPPAGLGGDGHTANRAGDGGNASGSVPGGGGGGGGYFGGDGGATGVADAAGGGGGSSWYDEAAATLLEMSQGSGLNPPNTDDPDYLDSNVGKGKLSGVVYAAGYGQGGAVITLGGSWLPTGWTPP